MPHGRGWSGNNRRGDIGNRGTVRVYMEPQNEKFHERTGVEKDIDLTTLEVSMNAVSNWNSLG